MSAQAFRSSRILHSMKSLMSGWSMRRLCILAARRVLPPLLMTAATWSNTRMKLKGPEGVPPPESFSLLERSVERSEPVPLPYLKSIASAPARRMMSSMVSSTDWMKQAEVCGYS